MKPVPEPRLLLLVMAFTFLGCTKSIPSATESGPDLISADNLTPTPIYCLYASAPAGTTTIPHPRNYMLSAASGNYIAFLEGSSLAAPGFFGADLYNVQTGTWTSKSFDIGTNHGAAAACQTKIVYGGGQTNGSLSATTVVHLFDVNTGSWNTAHLSAPRFDLAAAGYGNKILFAGGLNISAQVEFSSRVDIYDAGTNTWSTAELSGERNQLAGAAANNIIAFAGGQPNSGGGPYSKKVDFYNVQTGQWTQSSLSVGRVHMGAIGAGDLIFFAGGSTGGASSKVCDIYNTTTKTWSHTNMANAEGELIVTTLGPQVIFYGSDNQSNTTADVYNTCSGKWSTLKLAAPVDYSAAGSAGGKMLMGRSTMYEYKPALFVNQ